MYTRAGAVLEAVRGSDTGSPTGNIRPAATPPRFNPEQTGQRAAAAESPPAAPPPGHRSGSAGSACDEGLMAAVAFDYVSPNYGAVTRSRSMKRLVAKQPEAGVPGGRCTAGVRPQ